MPQLNIQDFAPQLIWLAISLILLYVILSRVALPRIAQVIETRETRIAEDFARAREAQQRAQEASDMYDQMLADARARSQALVRTMREGVERQLGEERAQKEAQMAERMASAERDIEQAREKALANVSAIAAETAGDIVRKVSGLDVTADEVAEVIGSSGRKTVEPVS